MVNDGGIMSTLNVKKTIVEAVPFYSIRHETEPDFDIYFKLPDSEEAKKYKKLVQKGDLYCSGKRAALAKKNVSELFIRIEDRDSYMEYMEKHLSAITQDASIPLKEKSRTIYKNASKVLEKIFDKPEAKENVSKVKNLVENTIDVVLMDERSIRSLIEVSSYDYYTYTHSVDVAVYAVGFGHFLGLGQDELKKLGYSAMMHDIGKSKVPSDIINKKGILTPEEFEEVKLHPHHGFNIMKNLGENDPDILAGVKYHHEKFDGNGYPDRIQGEEIPFFAQIIAISDVFSALSTKRAYKDAFSSFNALSTMKNEMTENFNPKLLLHFIKFMGQHYAK